MKRPDYLFAGNDWSVFPDPQTGGWLADDANFYLSLERVEVGSVPYYEELERGIWAWLMARGVRSVSWNGRQRNGAPDAFNFCIPENPSRVISVCPSNTEWLNLLGLQDRVIGLDSSSPFASAVPRLGRELTLDFDKLCDLNPDLVIASLSVPGMEKVITELFTRKIPHMVLAPQSLEEVRADCETLAGIFQAEDAAKPFLLAWDAAFAHEPPRQHLIPTFLEWWPKPIFSPAKRCWTNQLMVFAGAANIFGREPGQSVEVTAESVLEKAPELAIVSWCGVPHHKLSTEKMKGHPVLRATPAVKNDQVYIINEDYLGRPGPGLLKGLKELRTCVQNALACGEKICGSRNS